MLLSNNEVSNFELKPNPLWCALCLAKCNLDWKKSSIIWCNRLSCRKPAVIKLLITQHTLLLFVENCTLKNDSFPTLGSRWSGPAHNHCNSDTVSVQQMIMTRRFVTFYYSAPRRDQRWEGGVKSRDFLPSHSQFDWNWHEGKQSRSVHKKSTWK